jgi:hypothetical protein
MPGRAGEGRADTLTFARPARRALDEVGIPAVQVRPCHERAGSRAGASTTRPPPPASLSTVQGSDATGPPAALEHVGPRPLLPLSVVRSQSRA